jgi:hypothetical protein
VALKAAEFVIDAYHQLVVHGEELPHVQTRPASPPENPPIWITWLVVLVFAGSLARARSSALGFGPLEAPRAVPSLDSAVQPLVERRPRQVRFGSVATQ